MLTNIAHLVDQLEQGVLGGVHAHRPHGPPQLLRADVAAPVHVELVEGLGWKTYFVAQLYDICDDYWLFVVIIFIPIQISEKYSIYIMCWGKPNPGTGGRNCSED